MAPITHIELYKDKIGKSRWRMRRCGHIIADCGESYKRMSSCRKSVQALICSLSEGTFEIVSKLRPIGKKPAL